jgi:hypothetical protein
VPFRDLAVSWTLPTGSQRICWSVANPASTRGVFLGYWGVVRDVTDMHNARAALAATETRYKSFSPASPRRWCCTAVAVSWTPTPPAWRCLAMPT